MDWHEKYEEIKNRLEEEIRRLKNQIKELEEWNEAHELIISELERKIAQYEKAVEELKKLAEFYKSYVEKLKRSVSQYAIFVRPHPGGKPDEIDILIDNHLMKAALAIPKLTAKDLKCGWEVLVNKEGNVAEITKNYWSWGSKVDFEELLSEDIVLVSEHNELLQCFLSPELKNIKLKKGDYLLNCNGLIVKLLPKTECKDKFVDMEELQHLDWSQIGGLSKAIKKIKRKLLPFKEREAYINLFKGQDLPKGMILHGFEGCGKTLCAKAIASDLGRARGLKCYFMHIGGADLTDKYVGETARKLREMFARAKEKSDEGALVIIFIDEMDSLFRNRDMSDKEPWMATDIGQFNKILEGIEPLGNILVIGATNRKDLVDRAILRPGRLGIDIFIPRPRSEKDIKEILRIYLTADLPFAKKYFENDEYVYLDYFGNRKEERITLNKDRERIREHFIDVITKRLIYAGPPIKIPFDKENITVNNRFRALTPSGEKDVLMREWLSGAVLKSIVDNAKTLALERYVALKEAGKEKTAVEIMKRDFFVAIDEEFQRLKSNFRKVDTKTITGFKE
jgi:proteasome-associated ATPase